MTTEKKPLSDNDRISEIENAVEGLRIRLQHTESRLGVAARRSLGVPITFQSVYIPTIPLEGEFVAAASVAAPDCFEEVETPMSGQHDYALNVEAECPLPSPVDKAKAVIQARKNLEVFGIVWCAEGNNKCESRQCKPVLSKDKLRVDRYEVGSRPQTDGKKTCFVIAYITGTVSCSCGT